MGETRIQNFSEESNTIHQRSKTIGMPFLRSVAYSRDDESHPFTEWSQNRSLYEMPINPKNPLQIHQEVNA